MNSQRLRGLAKRLEETVKETTAALLFNTSLNLTILHLAWLQPLRLLRLLGVDLLRHKIPYIVVG